MKVIPETSRAQYIKYLYFHEYHWMDTYVAELISPRSIILSLHRLDIDMVY